jgi:hypothetical protein
MFFSFPYQQSGRICHILLDLAEYARIVQIYIFLQLKRKKKEKTKFLDVPDLARYVILPDLALSGKVQDLEESGLEMQNGLENNMPDSGRF